MAFVYTLCTAWGHFSGVSFFDILLFTHKKKERCQRASVSPTR